MRDWSKIILGTLVILFGLLALFYGIKYNQAKSTSELYLTEKNEVSTEYNELVKEFNQVSNELELMTIEKTEAYAELTSQKEQLDTQRAEIKRLLNNKNLSSKELDKARAMINELKAEKDNLVAKVDQLNKENAELRTENSNYSKTLTQFSKDKEQLQQEKVQLEESKKELEEEAAINAPKVAYSQLVPVKNLSVDGVKFKNSGRERETSNYKRVDKLAIQFTTENNPVASTGAKTYLVRITSPDGTILYDKQRGSGEFVNHENEGMKYTSSTTIDYEGDEKQVNLFWLQDLPFQKGNYNVEVFQQGFKVGEGAFELKGGL